MKFVSDAALCFGRVCGIGFTDRFQPNAVLNFREKSKTKMHPDEHEAEKVKVRL